MPIISTVGNFIDNAPMSRRFRVLVFTKLRGLAAER